MAVVYAKEKENFESLLRRFRKKVLDERVISTYRERTYFISSSEKKRRKKIETQKKIRKANARRESDIDRGF